MNIIKPKELNEKRQSCSCNAKDAVDGKPSAEDAGQERDTHLFTVQVIGVAEMGEISSVVKKCDITNLVNGFRMGL